MNRNQRRLGRAPRRNDSEGRLKTLKSRSGAEVDEVLPPRSRRELFRQDKPMTNRCCYVSPDQRDFGQLVQSEQPPHQDQYRNLLVEQYGFDPVIPDTINQLKELKKVLCGGGARVENGSQYVQPYVGCVETSDGSQWQNIENIDDIDNYIRHNKDRWKEYLTAVPDTLHRNIHISDVPKVKIIAEKFSRYKKNNIELRKLDEKVVCVEYDIYDQSSTGSLVKPVQRMRAFFSIRPVNEDDDKDKSIKQLPSEVKTNFKISEGDLRKLNEKEVEIIDGKIAENKPYLEDLKKILNRKRNHDAKKNKTSLDLRSLYEMARKNYTPENVDISNTNFLSKAELQEVKDLILRKCTSSVHGMSRRTVRREKVKAELNSDRDMGVISESIVAELLREVGNINIIN